MFRPTIVCTSLLCCFAFGCVDRQGVKLPPAKMAFPTAIELSNEDSTPDFLYVANSNFDLAFETGSVQAYSLSALDEALNNATDGCASLSDEDRDRCAIIPTELKDRDAAESNTLLVERDNLLLNEVLIRSYAEGITLSPDGSRLYLPVRSNNDLTFIDTLPDGRVECGGDPDERHLCDSDYTNTNHDIANDHDISLPITPVALKVGALADLGVADPGNFILMIHEFGQMSLFIDSLTPGVLPDFLYSIQASPSRSFNVDIEPGTGLVWTASASGSLMPRTVIGMNDNAEEGILLNSRTLSLGGGYAADVRDLRFYDPGMGAEIKAFVISRSPRELLILRLREDDEVVLEAHPSLGLGPSRMLLQPMEVDVGGLGSPFIRPIVFVSCFTSGEVFIIDGDLGTLITAIRGIPGPFEMKIDEGRNYLYVTDFTASVIRVYDLQPLQDCLNGMGDGDCAPALLGMLGIPDIIQEIR